MTNDAGSLGTHMAAAKDIEHYSGHRVVSELFVIDLAASEYLNLTCMEQV